MKTSVDFLNKASNIQTERGKDYDTEGGERSMAAVVGAFNALFGTNMTETQGWQFMALLKMRRLHSAPSHHEDSALDQVSYSALAAESSYRNNSVPPMRLGK